MLHNRPKREYGNEPYLVKVDHIQLFTGDAMKEATLFVQKHDLKRLELFSKLSRCDVGVDVEYLPIGALGQTGKNGQRAGANRCLERAFVDPRYLSNESILFSVEIICGEYARGNGSGPSAKLL